MGTETMGRVEVSAKLENDFDVTRLSLGMIGPESVRCIEVDKALVDTGATSLCAPHSIIEKLGLLPTRKKKATTTNGVVERTYYGTVRLTIQGRDFRCEVSELPENCPVLIGQIPLEGMDFVVDPVNPGLIGNPEHGGEPMHEEY